MSDPIIDPDEAIKEIQNARNVLWDIQRENFDADIEQPVLAIDKILRREQDRWKSKKVTPTEGEEATS